MGYDDKLLTLNGYLSYNNRSRQSCILGKGSGLPFLRNVISYPTSSRGYIIDDELGNQVEYAVPQDQIDPTEIYRNLKRKEYLDFDSDGNMYLYDYEGNYILYEPNGYIPKGYKNGKYGYTVSITSSKYTLIGDETIIGTKDTSSVTFTINSTISGSSKRIAICNVTLDSNNYINNVQIKTTNDSGAAKEIANNTYNIVEGSYIEVIDNITGKRLKVNLSGNRASSCYEAYNSSYTDKVVTTYYYDPNYNDCYIENPYRNLTVYYNQDNKLDFLKTNNKIECFKFNEHNWLISKSNVIAPNYQNSIKNGNLVNNGYFTSNTSGWTATNCSLSRYTDSSAPNGNYLYLQHTSASQNASIYQTINKAGKKGDLFTFGCWYVTDFCQEEAETGELIIQFIKNNTVVQTVTKELRSNLEDRGLWLYLMELIEVNNDYSSIKITFTGNRSDSCLNISGVELYDFINGNIYKRDDFGNLTETINSRSNIKYKTSFNSKKMLLIDNIIKDDSDIISIEYDDFGNIVKKDHVSDFHEEYTYYDEKNLKTYTKSNNIYTMGMENEYTNGRVSKTIDELGIETNYENDSRLGLVNSITDSVGNKIKYLYEDNIMFSGFEYYNNQNTLLDKTTISRNSNNVVTKIANLGSEYQYQIDSKNRTCKVTSSLLNNSNENTLEQYEFLTRSSTSLDAISKLITNNNDAYIYTYDDSLNVTKVELQRSGSQVLLTLCEYTYDDLDRVVVLKEHKINDNELGTTLYNTINYEYNKYGDLQRVYDTLGSNLEYIYKDDGSILYINELVNNKLVTHQVNNQLSNPNDFYNYMKYQDTDVCYSCFFNDKEIIAGTNAMQYNANLSYISGHTFSDGAYNVIPSNNVAGSNINHEGLFNSCILNQNFELSYSLNGMYPVDNSKFNVSFWFKDNKGSISRILRFEQKIRFLYENIEVILDNGYLKLYEASSSTPLITTTTRINSNEWNYLSVTYWIEDYGTGSYVTHYTLMLNDEIIDAQNSNISQITGDCTLIIGLTGTTSQYFNGKIASLIVNKDSSTLNEETMRDLYYTSKEYIIDSYEVINNQYINQKVISNQYVNETSYNPTFVLPLNNSFVCTNNKKPYIEGESSACSLSKAKDFSYNKEIGRYTYRANGKKLVYDFNNKNSFSYYMHTYFTFTDYRQYIFQNIDAGNNTLGLYRNNSNKLILEINGVEHNTNVTLSNNVWNKLMFSYESVIVASSSLSITVEHDVRIILNGSVVYTATLSKDFEFGYMSTSIGRTHDDIYSYPMYGQIEMFQVYNTYFTNSTAVSVCNSRKIISSVKKINQFGLLCGEERALVNGKLNKTNEYYINGSKIIPLIKKQEINNNLNIEYTYDNNPSGVLSKGLLTEYKFKKGSTLIQDSEYQYNDKSELLREEDIANNKVIVYTYDTYGNITSKVVNGVTYNYAYSSTSPYLPNLLIGYGNKTIKYSSTNKGYPIGYGTYSGTTLTSGYEYTWKGSKLASVYNVGSATTYFKYDGKGRRISKTFNQNGSTIEKVYYYTGNRLNKEVINDNINGYVNTITFLYDSTELYGFKYNSTEYYYIRNVLGDIIGITDSTNNIVCIYKYDAYGNHKVLNSSLNEDTSYYFIGNINPIRYRGYYYDVETNLFLVSSRYYSPELCRWISPDDIEYLDPESVNGLNLYCYCLNDPVMCR